MNYKVIILEEAKADIKEGRSYYRKILKSLSKRFTADVRYTVAEIKNHSFAYGFRSDNFRAANLSVFPYQVHYFISEEDVTVIIFAVLHAYRDPEFIKTRVGLK